MPEQARCRRFIIATGVTTDLVKSADRLVRSVGSIAELFQEQLGYERATALDLNPSAEDMRRELRAFARKCDPADFVALYHTGHADVVASRHRLWMGNTTDPVVDAMPTAELAELMLENTPVRNLLIILDTCFAGQGGTEVLRAGVRSDANFVGKTLLAITAAHPREQVRAGDFTGLFARSVAHPATAGYEPRYLSLPAIVGHINADPQRKAWQTVSYSTVFGTDEAPFLPNPRHDAALHGFDLATQLQMEQDEQRREDLEKFFNPRARGVDVPQEAGWNFVGRHVALRDLTSWLTHTQNQVSIVVTGDPGSGKSAVIGRLYIMSHRDWGRTVPRQSLPVDTIPPTDSIAVAIHARNRTSDEILRALCAAAGVVATTTAGEFLRARAGPPMVVAIDAIDEAVDTDRLISAVLNPLIENGAKSGLRLLLGTRSYVLDRMSPAAVRIDLDDQRYADPESLRIYSAGRLRAATGSPYLAADAARVTAVAEAIAQAAGRSFLVALITSRTLAAQRDAADPTDPAWRASLPGTAAQAMQQDLETRLGQDAARACDLLRPLAYARGNGLPWEDIWAPLASLLAGRDYRDEDLIWLRKSAGSYVVEALEAGRSVYRLYHAALAEYLRHGQDEKSVHGEFVRFLLDYVPYAPTGERAWPGAHPYVLSHLATHAAVAGDLERLVADPGYLACSAPLGLVAAFSTVRGHNARLIAVTYQRAMHRLRSSDLADRLSYLELAARRARCDGLAERIAVYPLSRRWSICWTQSPPDHPHRVLAGHHGPVREVVGVSAADRPARAASVGDDGTLRLWDIASAELLGVHEVNRAGLAAIDLAELPGPRQLAVVLSAAGSLTAHELPSMSRVLDVSVRSGLRGQLQMLQLSEHEMRCVRLPDGRRAAITGGPDMTTAIWDIPTGRPIVRLSAGLRPASLAFRNLASGDPVVVSTDRRLGGERIFEFATGREVPYFRPLTGSTANVSVYCRGDGTPAVGVILRHSPTGRTLYRNVSGIFDLTSLPARRVTRMRQVNRVWYARLGDGSVVRLRFDSSDGTPLLDSRGETLVRLADTAADVEGGDVPSADRPKHARPSEHFRFLVGLDGRVITLTPAALAPDDRRERVVLTGHGAAVTDADVAQVPSGPAVLVSSSLDNTVRVWDTTVDTGATAAKAADLAVSIVATMDHEGQSLGLAIMADEDQPVAVLDLGTGETVTRLGYPSGLVQGATCGWLPEIGPAAVVFGSEKAWIYQLQAGNFVTAFRTHVDAGQTHVDRLAIQSAYVPLPGRPLAVTCGHGHKAVVWDLANGKIHDVLTRHTRLISAVALGIDPAGALLAVTGGQDNRLNVWAIGRGRRAGRVRAVTRTSYLRRRESGYAVAVRMVTNRRGRPVILVLCEDGDLRIFEKRLWRFGYNRAALRALGASCLATMQLADGRTVVVTGSRDGRLCAWDLEAALATGRCGPAPAALVEIETETRLTGLTVAGDDTVVTSAPNGLAAFRFNAKSLAGIR
jgi:WD40 repeat protein